MKFTIYHRPYGERDVEPEKTEIEASDLTEALESRAIAVAVRGLRVTTDAAPKTSPGLNCCSTITRPSGLFSMRAIRPVLTTYTASAGSAWKYTISPWSNFWNQLAALKAAMPD